MSIPESVDAKTGYTVKFAFVEHSALRQLCLKKGVSIKKTNPQTLTEVIEVMPQRYPGKVCILPLLTGRSMTGSGHVMKVMEATHCTAYSFLLGSVCEETVYCCKDGTPAVSSSGPEW